MPEPARLPGEQARVCDLPKKADRFTPLSSRAAWAPCLEGEHAAPTISG